MCVVEARLDQLDEVVVDRPVGRGHAGPRTPARSSGGRRARTTAAREALTHERRRASASSRAYSRASSPTSSSSWRRTTSARGRCAGPWSAARTRSGCRGRAARSGRRPRMSISRQAGSGPEPPKASSAKSRTSSPRLTVTWRMAFAWFQAAISRTPAAHASREVPTGPPADRRPPRRRRGPAGSPRPAGARGCGRAAGRRRSWSAPCRPRRSRSARGRPPPSAARPSGPLRRDPRDRAAAGADGDDVDHRHLDGEAPDRSLGGEARAAAADHAPRRWRCRRRPA